MRAMSPSAQPAPLFARSCTGAVVARGCLPPGANVCVAVSANQIGYRYSYSYYDGIGVDCHEQYLLV